MNSEYDILFSSGASERLLRIAYQAARAPGSFSAKEYHAVVGALAVLREGREAYYGGKRLGYSPKHFDLRDCAEIKVPVVQEYNRRGRPLGPSHRMIYREYDSLPGRTLPVRQVIAFAPRADGQPFGSAGKELDRPRGAELDELEGFLNTRPAVGPDRDPDRQTTPPRLPATPDVMAAMATRITTAPAGPRRWSLSASAVASRRVDPAVAPGSARAVGYARNT